ncbi:hypothetical protein HHK36_023200 [Tetracentron sinense]|uniref:Tf2-1-like SH3-like domain-containing protein n=1 Tax=Tetracentron sinense TaxID=13715 RepID=A0A835D5M8_TETSI|nr:hypothetical protein HHK36_023200 [Tetracentron sinense]
MVKFLKPNKAVIVLQGRFAGRKAVIVRSFDEGTRDRPYGHCLVAGIGKYPKKVIRKDSAKKTAKKSRVKAFIKLVNYNHIMPTRYTLDVDLKDVITPDALQSRDKKVTAAKETKARFEERFKTGKNRWFFSKLRVRFAKMKLVALAKVWWTGVIRRMGQPPINTGQEMMAKLREKYTPANYHDKLAQADAFSKHISDIHDDARWKIALSNESYEAQADLRRKFTKFNEGDMVMVRIRPELGAYKKLHSKSAGLYKVLKKISSNSYVLDLLEDMGISNVFNIEDLTLYPGHVDYTSHDVPIARLPPVPCLKEEIVDH